MYAHKLGLGASGGMLDVIIRVFEEFARPIREYILGDEYKQQQHILLELDKLSWKDFDAL